MARLTSPQPFRVLPSQPSLAYPFGSSFRAAWLAALVVGLWLAACGKDTDGDPEPEATWSLVIEAPDSALASVHGTAADVVWAVGAEDGMGPLVMHWDGSAWQRLDSGVRGHLWWVHASRNGPVYFGGTDAHILRYTDGTFERMETPGLGKHTVYGLWAAAADDVYAVGSAAGRNGFVWHYDGQGWRELDLPDGIALDAHRDLPGLFKVWGTAEDDVWVVGDRGTVLRGNAADGFRVVPSGTEAMLFTVHGVGERVVIVGGESGGVVLESDGDGLVDRSPSSSPLLQGACVAEDGSAWAVGLSGTMYRSGRGDFEAVDSGLDLPASHSLHAAWMDPEGGVWAVGGNVLLPALDRGVLLHRGPSIAGQLFDPQPAPADSCPEEAVDPAPEGSIARRWNEQLLNAIRRDIPRPTVHARNLLHVSMAMWDAWAAYDAQAETNLLDTPLDASELNEDEVAAARHEAISYAAYRVLAHRYTTAVGGAISASCFAAFMQVLGYDVDDDATDGAGPRALGNRIGMAIIEAFADDGANEADDYRAPEPYALVNPNLTVDLPGAPVVDPTLWQKLVLAEAVTQNGIPEGAGVRDYIGEHWRDVTPFALERPAGGLPYLDIGQAPTTLDDDLVDAAVEVIRKTAELDVHDGVMMDISPGGYGNNSLGDDDGSGHPINPVTGEPYAPQLVRRGDFTRVMAEFWADGPGSETPPGHWNTLANHTADHPSFARRLFGEGEPVDRLAWDVHVYLALNGAMHDAAIAAWELKREYLTARPITLIRHLGGLGQRSDPNGPAYHPDGLPLVEGLIEVITEQSSAPGERHAHLARYVGEIALWSWRGEPGDRQRELGGHAWIRASEWIAYQRRTFVTPAFPGYVSGHSTFSRAGAMVLTELTGSPYFPEGLGSYRLEPGYLHFEAGPSEAIELQWATYFDAADQAGQSRLWGGIHVRQDDYDGRRVGAEVGQLALERARMLFGLPHESS